MIKPHSQKGEGDMADGFRGGVLPSTGPKKPLKGGKQSVPKPKPIKKGK